ncbi:alpha/beta fold hydrolase [Geodermatophilus sp. SYSU D00814]
MTEATVVSPPPHRRAGPRSVRRQLRVDGGHPPPARRRRQRRRRLQPPARYRRGRRLRRERAGPDPRPGARRRSLLRRGDHHQRRDQSGERRGLVYLSAFAPDEGEVLMEVEGGSTDSVLDTALVERQYPAGPDGQTVGEFSIDPAQLHDVFAADLTAEQAADMAATQRPVSSLGFSEPNGTPAWRTLPSWALVCTGDRAAGADVVRRMAQRAGAVTTEAEGSHVLFVARPEIAADVIRQALDALARGAATPAPAAV